MTLTVAGAGMAGLVAAARLRELGGAATVHEKGDRVGGSMLLSSGVVWRHREFDDFRRECPAGDERLQRLIWDRLDDAIAWLETTTGVTPVWNDTENPRTTGRRYAPAELTAALLQAAGAVRLNEPFPPTASPLVLATGGFGVRLAREHGLLVRSNPWSEGDGLDHARSLGAGVAGDLGEFYGRVMPAPPARVREVDFVGLSQLYGGHAVAVDEEGERIFEGRPAWHESDIAQAIARQPGGTAWYSLPRSALDLEALRSARAAGANVLDDGDRVRVRVIAGVTHTLGGLEIDERARVLREDGTAIAGLYAAGVDAGGIASGGYASGLAQALVLGLVAAEEALAE